MQRWTAVYVQMALQTILLVLAFAPTSWTAEGMPPLSEGWCRTANAHVATRGRRSQIAPTVRSSTIRPTIVTTATWVLTESIQTVALFAPLPGTATVTRWRCRARRIPAATAPAAISGQARRAARCVTHASRVTTRPPIVVRAQRTTSTTPCALASVLWSRTATATPILLADWRRIALVNAAISGKDHSVTPAQRTTARATTAAHAAGAMRTTQTASSRAQQPQIAAGRRHL